MDLITEAIISAVMPKCPDVAAWVAPLNSAMSRFDITDGRRAAAFLAQVAHESSELTHLIENLSYSAATLMQVWPRRFPTLKKARTYERNPEKLANYVYASRLGNGDEEDFETISIRINSGRAGLESRKKYWQAAKDALGVS